MLKAVISKANQILRDAQQRLSLESADAVEKVCIRIENLNDYINLYISICFPTLPIFLVIAPNEHTISKYKWIILTNQSL